MSQLPIISIPNVSEFQQETETPDIVRSRRVRGDDEVGPGVPSDALVVAVEVRAPALLRRRPVGEPMRERGDPGVVQGREFQSYAPSLKPAR